MGLTWAIAHDPCRIGDRTPSAAVAGGAHVQVVLHVNAGALSSDSVQSARVLVCENDEWRAVDLEPCGDGFTGGFDLADAPHVAYYAFELQLSGDEVAYYVPRADGRSTAGEVVFPLDDGWWEEGWHYYAHRLAERPEGDFGLEDVLPGFQITVYDQAFSTPDWFAGAIMYQIFPDRFARGVSGVREQGLAYHERMGRPVHFHANWGEPVEFTGDPFYDPLDFYGGTLAGIREKLPYLASLGVEVLYLNPVFEARSNHRYDTADYERIDPLLGDEREFEALVNAAETLGISVVLDAVLSHTGDDSRYFNARGTYEGQGAAQGSGSPYRSWYFFSGEGEDETYRSWWGFESLPEVDEHDPSWQHYMLGTGQPAGDGAALGEAHAGNVPGGGLPDGRTPDQPAPDGILPRWLHRGVRGYRLDVADELPDDVLELIRGSVRRTRPDAAIIGEVWEDATTKTSYGCRRTYALGRSLDSVMNYPLRNALIGFALEKLDAHQLATFLKSQQANYPAPMYRCLMNLLSTHDVERVRTVLSLGGSVKGLSREEQLKAVQAISPRGDARAARLQRMIAGLLYALPGDPCLYYGDERGLQGGGDPFCRATFPWPDASARVDCGEDVTAFYQKIGTMRKGSPALRRGEFACTAYGPDVLCAVRALPETGELVVAVTNRSSAMQGVALDLLSPGLALSPEARALVRDACARRVPTPFLSCEDGIALLTVAPASTRFFPWAIPPTD